MTVVLHMMSWEDYLRTPDEPLRPASLHSEGFVHCTADEPTLLAVANAFYQEVRQPQVAVQVETDRLTAPVLFEEAAAEPPGVTAGTRFPHVYGPIDRQAVVGVLHARRDLDGTYRSFERQPALAGDLGLLPHPEGGWYRRTWTSPQHVDLLRGRRATATSILYLLCDGETSQPHTVASDELWLWHGPGRVELMVDEQLVELGSPTENLTPQAVVPADAVQYARAHGDVVVSCVVSPGFDFADFRVTPAAGSAR